MPNIEEIAANRSGPRSLPISDLPLPHKKMKGLHGSVPSPLFPHFPPLARPVDAGPNMRRSQC